MPYQYTKEQLEEMMKGMNHIETVLRYFAVPTAKVIVKLKYVKEMIQMGIDNAKPS